MLFVGAEHQCCLLSYRLWIYTIWDLLCFKQAFFFFLFAIFCITDFHCYIPYCHFFFIFLFFYQYVSASFLICLYSKKRLQKIFQCVRWHYLKQEINIFNKALVFLIPYLVSKVDPLGCFFFLTVTIKERTALVM